MNKKKKPAEIDFPFSVYFYYFIILLLREIYKILAFLTQYFPFSLISDQYFFHHKKRQQNEIYDTLFDISLACGVFIRWEYLETDDYFHYFISKISKKYQPKLKLYFKKIKYKLGEGRVFVSDLDKKIVSLRVIKEELI